MDGFPLVSLVNEITNDLTNELLRIKPEYREKRWAELASMVKDGILELLRRRMPTLYREYRRENADLTESHSQVTMQRG